MRVKVWDGSQKNYLGLGDYTSDVPVYVYMDKNGAIRSCPDAEQQPETIPEGCELRVIQDNPRIVLDSGRVVYGCQVWWKPVQEIVEVQEDTYDPWAVAMEL